MRLVYLVLAFFLTGCATNKIFLHSYKIDEPEIKRIASELVLQGFEVSIEARPPPMINMGSFIIYPKSEGDNDALIQIFDVINEHYYYTNFIAKNRVRNHSYTKNTYIGLYLINPNIGWQNEEDKLKLGFVLGLSEASFSSIDCRTLFTLDFDDPNKGVISHNAEESPQNFNFLWKRNGDVITLTSETSTLDLSLTQEYQRQGNRNDLILNLSPGNAFGLGLDEPYSCHFQSRTPLID